MCKDVCNIVYKFANSKLLKRKTMAQMVLKNEIVDSIKTEAILFGKVADALNIQPVSLPYLLKNNSTKLTQLPVITVLKEHLSITEDSELLQEVPEESLT